MAESNTDNDKWYTIDIGGTQFKLPVRYQNVALITQNANSVIVWWLSPEVFLGDKRYGDKVDIWSVGCIMGEFILGQSLFCGDDSLDQFDQIFDIIGTPDLAILNDYKISEITSYIRRLPVRPRIDYNEWFGYRCSPTQQKLTFGISPEGIDFLDSLLTFDYRMRPTVEEALMHPYLKEYHNPAKEPTAELFLDENVDEDYEIDTWKSLIWKMVQEFEPPSWANEISETVEL
ncbi:unnamed protein product [Adineta ricciae]|uniref:Protein kinase domain-containing protein n=1 Tax=Adineta ricciae TaxID=249248 RepID=A0A813YS98_ADIRI|nr:unnamed protein product [Adineta ricciae]